MELEKGFGFLGHYKNGQAIGDFWAGMKGGGYLHGIEIAAAYLETRVREKEKRV